MLLEIKLPDIGEGIVEGEIIRWLVKEGDVVKEDQPLVEVLTEKVNVEIPSPAKGTVAQILAKEGDIVKVGQTLLVIAEAGERVAPPTIIPQPAQPVQVKAVAAVSREERAETVLAAPAVRRLARELDVDLALVAGTGPKGRITEEDVRRAGEAKAKPAAIAVPQERAREERVPLRGLRRKIAEKMTRSVRTTAPVTHVDEVDMTELVDLRAKSKEVAEKRGVKLTYLPFIIKALVHSLKEYPYFNASLDDERGEIILKNYYNIGIATDTTEGLVVPVIKDADRKGIYELAEEIERLAQKAREGRLELADVQGGTFTITNVGPIGGLFATPIINHPEVAILGVHAITKRPVVRDDEVKIRDMMYLSLSFDHRVIDGATAARFTRTLIKYLEDPKLLPLELG